MAERYTSRSREISMTHLTLRLKNRFRRLPDASIFGERFFTQQYSQYCYLLMLQRHTQHAHCEVVKLSSPSSNNHARQTLFHVKTIFIIPSYYIFLLSRGKCTSLGVDAKFLNSVVSFSHIKVHRRARA